jgi:uncharacterized repeat protein (TIGR03803 family)
MPTGNKKKQSLLGPRVCLESTQPLPENSFFEGGIMGKAGLAKLICIVFAFCLVTALASPAQTFTTVYNFAGYPNDGFDPFYGPLIQGSDGNFYGTTAYGGANNGGSSSVCPSSGCGTVFKVIPGGTVSILYSFCAEANCTDGAVPYAGLVQGTDGNFYGTTAYGGMSCTDSAYGCGTVFQLTPAGVLTTLHSFAGSPGDGTQPQGALVEGTDGNFYGTTYLGGSSGSGTFFQITPAGTLTELHFFVAQSTDGAYPSGGLMLGSDGNFWGTTTLGGSSGLNGYGTVFKTSSTGTLRIVHAFCSVSGCADSQQPYGALVQGSDGNFYGTTSGAGTDEGSVFKITLQGTLTTLHHFAGSPTEGAVPYAGLIQNTDGNFYGTTAGGGANSSPTCAGCGTAFGITPGGTLTTLYSFCSQANCADGYGPYGALVQGKDGSIYGTTNYGGTVSSCDPPYGCGTVFNLAQQPTTTAIASSVNPSPYGQSVTFTATVTRQGSGTPTGTVTFTYGSTTLCNAVTLSGGIAACTYSTLPLGADMVTATYSGDYNFTGSSATITLTVNQGTPVITWPTPTPIYYGTPLGAIQLNAIANVPGTFVFTPAAGTVLNVGNQPLSVTFTPTNTTDYTTATATVTLVVNADTGPASIPVLSPMPSTYNSPVTITISEQRSGTTIYYTQDGSIPTTNSPVYSGPFQITETETVRAMAMGGGFSESPVVTGTYTLQALKPGFSPLPSTYSPPKSVTLTEGTSGATVYFTTDGSTPSGPPNVNGTAYSAPFALSQATTTVNAIAVGTGYNPSTVATGVYTLQALTPGFSPLPSTYTTPPKVTITEGTSGATIFYTTDGSTPSQTNGTQYTVPIVLTQTTTIKAIVIGTSGYNQSAVATGTYTIN